MKYDNIKQGDILWLDFDPSIGKETQKRRPAIVVSATNLTRVTGMAWVMPITSTDRGWHTHIRLPIEMKTHGVIMCEHMRSYDIYARNAELIEKAPNEVVDKVKTIAKALIS